MRQVGRVGVGAVMRVGRGAVARCWRWLFAAAGGVVGVRNEEVCRCRLMHMPKIAKLYHKPSAKIKAACAL